MRSVSPYLEMEGLVVSGCTEKGYQKSLLESKQYLVPVVNVIPPNAVLTALAHD